MQRANLNSAGLGLMLVSLIISGCGSDGGLGAPCGSRGYSCGQLCDGDTPPAACGLDCSNAGCPTGYYCGADDTCTADCAGAGDRLCGDGTCSTDGVCVGPDTADQGTVDMGRVVDLGPPVDMGTTDQGDGVCARVSVEATRVTPNVIFLIDRSGSMGWELDLSDGAQCPEDNDGNFDCYDSNSNATRNRSRWRGLRSALVGTSTSSAVEGLIGDLQDQVRFGAVTYRGPNNACVSLNNMSPVNVSGMNRVGVVEAGATPSARDVIAGDGTVVKRFAGPITVAIMDSVIKPAIAEARAATE